MMTSTIEGLTRSKARELLAQFRSARAHGHIIETALIGEADWLHPLTQERARRAEALESAIEQLLAARAGV